MDRVSELLREIMNYTFIYPLRADIEKERLITCKNTDTLLEGHKDLTKGISIGGIENVKFNE